MTKIAISPNASGTGTFTLTAPNSNDDRTFTLPDATGEVLTDAENNPAKLFRRDNILGTVSQSGGVPTGAVIERGSNANGEFVKYADGTLICSRFVTASNISYTNGGGSGHKFTQEFTFSWPVNFISPPIAASTIQDAQVSGRSFWLPFLGQTATGFSFRLTCLTTTNLLDDANISVIAIGRWY